jgi:Swt1-like HEPN
MTSDVDNSIKAFGMSGYLINDDLRQFEQKTGISLGHISSTTGETSREATRFFEAAVRREAEEMAHHYVLFYCLEKSIRQLISNLLSEPEVGGPLWWDSDCVPTQIKDEVKRRRKEETDSGVTPRSDDPIDFTTFGELEVIITSNWKSFESVFDSQRAVQRIIKQLNVLRGPIAHCCAYSEDEKQRLELTVKDWIRLL